MSERVSRKFLVLLIKSNFESSASKAFQGPRVLFVQAGRCASSITKTCFRGELGVIQHDKKASEMCIYTPDFLFNLSRQNCRKSFWIDPHKTGAKRNSFFSIPIGTASKKTDRFETYVGFCQSARSLHQIWKALGPCSFNEFSNRPVFFETAV